MKYLYSLFFLILLCACASKSLNSQIMNKEMEVAAYSSWEQEGWLGLRAGKITLPQDRPCILEEKNHPTIASVKLYRTTCF